MTGAAGLDVRPIELLDIEILTAMRLVEGGRVAIAVDRLNEKEIVVIHPEIVCMWLFQLSGRL